MPCTHQATRGDVRDMREHLALCDDYVCDDVALSDSLASLDDTAPRAFVLRVIVVCDN
jgi:hypothetical protein